MRKIAVLIFCMFFTFLLFAEKKSGTLTMTVKGLKSGGTLMIAIFDNDDGFPSKSKNAVILKTVPVKKSEMSVSFPKVIYGTYAVSVFHDMNNNGKLDTNWIGMPKEGIGASNDAKGFMGPPKFEDAKFPMDKPEKKIKINIKYL